MHRVRFALALMAGALAGIAGLCATASAQQGVMRAGPFSAGVNVGILIPQSMHVAVSGAIAGPATLNFNPAGAISGFIGYDLTDHFGAEADLGWTLYDPSDIKGSLASGGGTVSTIPLNGDFNTVFGMLNAIYRPLGRSGRFSPYLGLGLGFVLRDWGMTSRPGAAVTLDVREREEDLAANLMAGLDYAITDHFSVGGRYRFLWIDTQGETLESAGVTVGLAHTYAHVLTATLRYRF